MKLKLKLPLLFTIIIIVLALLFAAFIKVYIIEAVLTNVISERGKYAKDDNSIVEVVSNHSQDSSYLDRYFSEKVEKGKVSIHLYDNQLNNIYSFNGTTKHVGPGERWYTVERKDGLEPLLISINRPLYVKNIMLNTVFIKSFWLLLAFLLVAGIVLTIYFHYLITIPIQKLNNRLQNIKASYNRKSLSFNRKDEIGELYKHVEEMENRIRKSHQEQVDMIAAITHDIKTPLTSINGFIELLQLKPDLTEKDKKEYLDLIEKKAKHVTSLMNEFSSYTKNEVILSTIKFESIAVRDFFYNIAVEYEAELTGLDYQFTYENRFGEEDLFSIDQAMIRRVFANIISNSVRYSSVEDLHVKMIGGKVDHLAVFQIMDNGVGVPEKDISKIFQKFFTVDQSRQVQEGGTGLGLASCESIIDRHGGKIEAFHSETGGLGIRFSLPLE